MKLHLSKSHTVMVMLVAVCGSAFAVDTIDKGSINKTSVHREVLSFGNPAIVKYDSIKSDGVELIGKPRSEKYVDIEINSIECGDKKVQVQTDTGNISLGDVQGGYITVSTGKGDITLTGNIQASEKDENGQSVSTISVSNNITPGRIILDGATVSNVGFSNYCWDENYKLSYGTCSVSGNTTLTGVYFHAGTVEVAAGSNLTLNKVLFTSNELNNNNSPAEASLVLGDNVTLTLNEGDTLNVKDLTIGSDVNIVITLSSEAFQNLDNSEFNVFSVVEGEIDVTAVNFTFTDGQQYKSGTVSANGGSISVTDTHIVPEPTTATLSLLALAGLAVRRRRK